MLFNFIAVTVGNFSKDRTQTAVTNMMTQRMLLAQKYDFKDLTFRM